MAQLIQPFNAHNFDPTQSAGMLPVGRHPVVIESSEVKANKANDGGYLQFNLKIIDGPAAGQTGAYRLNLYHANPQTVEIANRQLSAISHVTGVFMISDSAQLHNIPFVVEVGTQKPTREQEEARQRGENVTLYTEVKKVFDINGNEPGKQGQGGGAAQPQQQQPQQQQPQGQPPAGAWGGAGQGQPQGQQQPPAGGWRAPGGQQPQGQGQPQGQPQGQGGGAGWQPPAGGAAQGKAPANGGSAWGGAPQGQQQPQGQQGNAGGWQQGNAGGGAPWGQQ